MITVLLQMTVKADRQQEFREMALELTATSRAEDPGCLLYAFFNRTADPRETILFEQWQDQESLDSHIRRLQDLLGPPDGEEPYPASHHRRGLPKAFLSLFENTEAARYEPVEREVVPPAHPAPLAE